MIDSIRKLFFEQIDERLVPLKKRACDGISDVEQYRRACGEIAALEWAKTAFNDAIKRRGDDDDE